MMYLVIFTKFQTFNCVLIIVLSQSNINSNLLFLIG